MQKKFSYSLLILFGLCLGACGASKKTSSANNAASTSGSTWQSIPIIVDGNSNDWDKTSMDYDKDSKIAYEITNDAKNLYVLLLTSDGRSQMKILSAGMSLFIDPEGKKKESTVINFPITAPQSGIPQFIQSGQGPDRQQMQAQAIHNANQYVLAGFKTGSGGYSILQKNDAGIELKIGYSTTGEMAYEALIPFSSLYNGVNIASAGNKISVGFKIKGFPKPDMPGGGGMPPGGGRPGGDMSEMQNLFNDTKVWKTISMSVK